MEKETLANGKANFRKIQTLLEIVESSPHAQITLKACIDSHTGAQLTLYRQSAGPGGGAVYVMRHWQEKGQLWELALCGAVSKLELEQARDVMSAPEMVFMVDYVRNEITPLALSFEPQGESFLICNEAGDILDPELAMEADGYLAEWLAVIRDMCYLQDFENRYRPAEGEEPAGVDPPKATRTRKTVGKTRRATTRRSKKAAEPVKEDLPEPARRDVRPKGRGRACPITAPTE